MDPALMGAIIIACCFAAGVFETGRRKKNRKDGGEHAPETRKGGGTR